MDDRSEPTTFAVTIKDPTGPTYTGRITGELVALEAYIHVYLTVDDRVIVYDERARQYQVIEDPDEQLRDLLSPEVYLKAIDTLGRRPIVDL